MRRRVGWLGSASSGKSSSAAGAPDTTRARQVTGLAAVRRLFRSRRHAGPCLRRRTRWHRVTASRCACAMDGWRHGDLVARQTMRCRSHPTNSSAGTSCRCAESTPPRCLARQRLRALTGVAACRAPRDSPLGRPGELMNAPSHDRLDVNQQPHRRAGSRAPCDAEPRLRDGEPAAATRQRQEAPWRRVSSEASLRGLATAGSCSSGASAPTASARVPRRQQQCDPRNDRAAARGVQRFR